MEPGTTEKKRYLLFNQSSELEILVSAAIVFAAFKLYDLVPSFLIYLINENISNQSPLLFSIAIISLFLGALLPLSIVLHFIIRFYWLSLVGLKTAYLNPKWTNLNYNEKYLNLYKSKIDLESHIQKVDRVSSSIFAFSFLAVAIFIFTSISVITLMRFFIYLIDDLFVNSWFQSVIIVLLGILLFILLMGFIDFITLGALKRINKKWFIKIYFPISKVLSIITFSFLYRGLYYTFITNVPKSLTAILLPFYMLTAIILLNLGFYESRIYEEDISSVKMGEYAIVSDFYGENIDENDVLQGPFISSYIVKGNSLQFTYALTEEIDDALVNNCDSVYEINSRGLHWRKWIRLPFNQRELPDDFDFDKNASRLLSCFADNIHIIIDDSLYTDQQFRFQQLQKPEKIVLTTIINISDLEAGDHVFKVKLQEPIGTDGWRFPFYKEQ